MTEIFIVMAFLVVLSVEDIIWKEVHLAILLAFFTSGCLYYFIVRQFSADEFFGGIVSGAFILVLSLCFNGVIGSADGIVFASTGAFLGLYDNLLLILLSVFVAGIGGEIAIIFFKCDKETALPLIPFITAGFFIFEGVRLC
ncbi:MAG: hypothetical protein DUD27_02785 [Lachnospiraceae bacterium]|uniref:Prepilin type IV endopeptidase peptidase domain-containing protein n=1 Tax=Candidatus Weimeria bifida TaxID=2599074 RepID=A0A6N7J0G1_9FIRM|nr:hypothetical protein [Candidatus Weimeria bifida]RRF96842.1 MAG: hypothetical protein DUD27_02785 [Lachnospiraceae bacterium]